MNYALQARWIVPIDRPPIAGGIVSIADDRIVAVGENVSGRPPTDLGDVAILPGFVNAHTHLEFSLLDKPLGTAGMPFPDWIRCVVEHRRLIADPAQHRRDAVARGLAESAAAGVCAIGEIAPPDFPTDAYASENSATRSLVLMELLGLAPQRAQAAIEQAREYLGGEESLFGRGLSPHAPYTVGPDLLRAACALSADHRVPLAMHLAESREELELLTNHTGPLVELLMSLSAWHPSSLPLSLRPLDYLETLQNAHRALIVHGNYLTLEEIEFIGARRENMSIVYCPRTHAYFRHAPYPLRNMLAAGVRVAIGTDSRASNPDLSLLAELRHLAATFRGIAPDKILEMGTLAAAEALGIDTDFGSINVGKRAHFAVVPTMERRQDPCGQVLFGGMPCYPWPPVRPAKDPAAT